MWMQWSSLSILLLPRVWSTPAQNEMDPCVNTNVVVKRKSSVTRVIDPTEAANILSAEERREISRVRELYRHGNFAVGNLLPLGEDPFFDELHLRRVSRFYSGK